MLLESPRRAFKCSQRKNSPICLSRYAMEAENGLLVGLIPITLTKMARTFSHIRACISHVHLHRHIVCANSACGHIRTHNVSANDACNSVLLEHYTHSHAYSHAYRIACGACICMRCTQYSARITACTRCIAHALILTPCKWKKNINTIIMKYSSYYLSIWPWYQPISLLQ